MYICRRLMELVTFFVVVCRLLVSRSCLGCTGLGPPWQMGRRLELIVFHSRIMRTPLLLRDGGLDAESRLHEHVLRYGPRRLRPGHAPEGCRVDEPRAHPLFVDVDEHRADGPHHRLGRREDPDDPGPALYLLVRQLLDVVGAQPDVVLVGEVEVGHQLVDRGLELASAELEEVDRAVLPELRFPHRFVFL